MTLAVPVSVRRGALIAAFAATRVLVLLVVFRLIVLQGHDPSQEVTGLYHHWYEVFRAGSFPAHDVSWQYPPGAALAMLAPRTLPFLSYGTAFIVQVLAADIVAFVLLLRGAGDPERTPGRSYAGAWLWVVGTAMIGPTVYGRFDLQVTVLAMASLLVAVRSPRGSGVLAGLGAALKIWPALLLLGAPRGRQGRTMALATALSAVGVTVALTLWYPGGLSFLGYQRARGTEVESVGGLVFQLLRYTGHWGGGGAHYRYGSLEFLGPHVALVSHLALLCTIVAAVWLAVWRYRARVASPAVLCDAALAAVLLFTITSRVLSPQYLVWLVGLAAVCVTWQATVQKVPAVLILIAAAITGAEYPALFHDVAASNALGVTILVARNGLLVLATVIACRNLWRSTVPPTDSELAGARVRTRSTEDAA